MDTGTAYPRSCLLHADNQHRKLSGLSSGTIHPVRNSAWFDFYCTVDSKVCNKRKWWKVTTRALVRVMTAAFFYHRSSLLTSCPLSLWLFDWAETWNALEIFSALCPKAPTDGKKCIRNIGLILQDLLFLAILVLQKTKLEEFPVPLPFPSTSQVKPKDFEKTKQWGSEITSTYPWPSGVGPWPWDTLRHFRNKCLGDWIEASTRPMPGSRGGPQLGHQKLLTGTHRSCRGAALCHAEIPMIRVPLPVPELKHHPG